MMFNDSTEWLDRRSGLWVQTQQPGKSRKVPISNAPVKSVDGAIKSWRSGGNVNLCLLS